MNRSLEQVVEELAALRVAFEAVRQPLLVVDAQSQTIVEVNPAACALLECVRGELAGRYWPSAVRHLPTSSFRRVSDPGQRFVVMCYDPAAGGERRGFARDPLTDLATREALLARLSQLDVHATTSGLAVLFIDLDHFKQVNDNLGHLAGDRVLRVVAARLAESIRPGDLVVRFGGDEFIVLVEGLRQRRGLERLAQRIRRRLRLPIVFDGHELVISASIGIAQQTGMAPTSQSLIAAADRDMYRVKALNRSTTETIRTALSRTTITTTHR